MKHKCIKTFNLAYSFLLKIFKTNLILLSAFTAVVASNQINIVGPPNSNIFGHEVVALPNGNIVITDPLFDIPSGASNVGAVYLYNGKTKELLSAITGSNTNDAIGNGGILVLSTGNYLIISPSWDNGTNQNAGAITFGNQFSGISGKVSDKNSLVGDNQNDSVGSPILRKLMPLSNGNYLYINPKWNENRGAVTLINSQKGTTGVVSSTNSLIGSNPNDQVGAGRNQRVDVQEIDNGNYVVISSNWNTNRGAVTLCDGNTGCNNIVSVSNSLIGTQEGDSVGVGSITKLTNGNYVVLSDNWNNGTIEDAGAATFCNANTGTIGEVSSLNSIVGSHEDDHVGIGVTPLTNGNYVVSSTVWNESLGAATFGNGSVGTSGTVSKENSLIGEPNNNQVGANVTPLTNGNYVVGSPSRDGAATFGNGNTGISGVVSKENSLVGGAAGRSIIPLSNGNYVVQGNRGVSFGNGITGLVGRVNETNTLLASSPEVTPLRNGNYVVADDTGRGSVTLVDGTIGFSGFPDETTSLVGTRSSDCVGDGGVIELANGNVVVTSRDWFDERGAVTFINGKTGLVGEVSELNSLIGSVPDENVGGGVFPLSNGNYVILSLSWQRGFGAVTFGNGNTGVTGFLSASNSLVGNNAGDRIGNGGIFELPNNKFLVRSFSWNDGRGAITFANGTVGINGEVSSVNSLVGNNSGDNIGFLSGSEGLIVLPDGNYLVQSPTWDNNSVANAGALTYCDKETGCLGIVSAANSLVGTHDSDFVGGRVKTLLNGNFIVAGSAWDNGNLSNSGAITLGLANKLLKGFINEENSVLGTISEGGFNLSFDYDYFHNQLVVGRPDSNLVTLFKYSLVSPKFDFDGDSKTDIGIFRPSVGEWWYLRSSDLGNRALQFGSSTDIPTPADFTGDGKTDISFFRNGEWFVLRSEDDSFFSFPWGTNGDIPAPGDFDGDGNADPAVFRPNDQTWFILKSTGGADIIPFGIAEDKPVIADYDGDGKDDIAIYRPSNGQWWINQSTDGVTALQFGEFGDKTVQGDYTGDGKADVAFFRPSTGEWFIIRSEDSSFFSFPFGATGDIAAPGDYDGDETFDTAVFRPSNTTWFINGTQSVVQIVGFGLSDDIPVPSVYSVP